MKTSISSKAFCSITDRQTDKIFTEYMLFYEGNLHKKRLEQYLNQGPRISLFPLNVVDIRTDGHLLLQSSFATNNKVFRTWYRKIFSLFFIGDTKAQYRVLLLDHSTPHPIFLLLDISHTFCPTRKNLFAFCFADFCLTFLF